MGTKFIFDRVQKRDEETIEEIFQAVRKKEYPDPNTTILADFVHAMFKVNMPVMKKLEREKKEEEKEEQSMDILKPRVMPLPMPPKYHPEPLKVEEPLTPTAEEVEKPESLLPPPPKEEKLDFNNQTYTITTFNTPISVSLEKDSAGKPLYKLREPEVNEDALKLAKELIADDFKKDFKMLDNQDFMKKKLEKACKKNDVECTPEIISNLTYHLKRDLLGFRRIDPVMYDDNVRAMYCDGLNKPVTIEFKDTGKVTTNIVFKETKDLNNLLAKLAKATGNELSEAKPILDTVFQGYRVQAVLGIGGASSKLIIKKE